MFFFFSYLILVRKFNSFISGFNTSSEEEQQQMIQQGYPRAIGRMMLTVGIILTVGFLLQLLGVVYAIEGSYIGMVIFIFLSLFRLNKYGKIKSKKINKNILILSFILVIAVFAIPFLPNSFQLNENSFKISGLYGEEWAFTDIEDVFLYDELPNITFKTNGISMFGKQIGNFHMEELGAVKLFVHSNQGPYLVIHTKDHFIIMNSNNPEKTTIQFDQLRSAYKTKLGS